MDMGRPVCGPHRRSGFSGMATESSPVPTHLVARSRIALEILAVMLDAPAHLTACSARSIGTPSGEVPSVDLRRPSTRYAQSIAAGRSQ
jgi:hypothetical protein